VTDSPVGQASVDFTLPFDAEEARRLSWRAGFSPRDLALVKAPSSSVTTQPVLTLQEVGTRLFDAAFGGDVGKLFFRSLDAAEQAGKDLRLRLQFDEIPEVAELPWEYLYSRDLDRFLALSTRTPLVRYVALAQRARSLAVKPPLRLLAILSNPSDLPKLDVEAEWARLNEALFELVVEQEVIVERLAGATLADLRAHLLRGEVNILHFIGHGDFDAAADEGCLIFEDKAGKHVKVTAKELATLLHDHEPLRLVFLNACHGATSDSQDFFAGVAQRLVQQGVPAVVAMQFAVSDRSAITLAHAFYQSLTVGLPLESAVSEARKAIFSEGERFEWGTPVTFSRSLQSVLVAGQNEEQNGGEGMDESQQKPWWEQVGPLRAGGDVIIASVGPGAKNVAIGKNITQQIYEAVGEPAPDDKEVIQQKLDEVNAALMQQQALIVAAKTQQAQTFLELLRGELTKTEESETPSANTIILVGNWLLDNVPEILEAVTSLFATPAVGRVIGKAGEVVVNWVKERFG
jgi:hypothetical protein